MNVCVWVGQEGGWGSVAVRTVADRAAVCLNGFGSGDNEWEFLKWKKRKRTRRQYEERYLGPLAEDLFADGPSSGLFFRFANK